MPVALVTTALFMLLAGAVRALPDAGTETMNVTGEVGVSSRLGTETISFSGTFTVQRGDPYNDAGVDVVDTEIISLELEGDSVTGPVTVVLDDEMASLGEIRSLQSPEMFPASSYFDLFIEVSVPISGGRSSPVIHNEAAIRIVPMAGDQKVSLAAWPPVGVSYEAMLDPCVPLLPDLPAEICVTDVSFEIGSVKTSTPTPTFCPPEVCTPLPTDTAMPCPGECPPTATPTVTPTPTPVPSDTPPATATPPDEPTATATPSDTPTPTATETETGPPATPSPSPTVTDQPATETPLPATPSPTPTITPTHSPVPTATLTPTPTLPPMATPPATATDPAVASDDAVNATDAALLLQYVTALINSLPCPEGGDVSGDGAFDVLDAVLILQFSAGLIDPL
jgi:hypothetical protein